MYTRRKSSHLNLKTEDRTVCSSDAGLTALGMGTSNCVPDGARTARSVCPEMTGDTKKSKDKLMLPTLVLKQTTACCGDASASDDFIQLCDIYDSEYL